MDLNGLSKQIGALIEEREMIPEAAMHAKNGRFHIFLKATS